MNLRLIFLLSLFFFNCPNTVAQTSDEICRKKLKIGVATPLSGTITVSTGEASKNSIILADELYDKNHCVEFIFEDSQLNPRITITIVNKFINQDKVDGIIILGTPTSVVASEIAERKKIPMIGLSILPKVVENKQFVMKHWCTADKLNKAVVEEVRKQNYESIAIVASQNDASLLLRDLFVKSNVSKVLIDEEFNKDNFDFPAIVTKILSKKPSAVYNLLFPSQTSAFMKELRNKRYNGEVFGVHNLEDPHEIASAEKSMENAWFANSDDEVGEMNYPDLYKKRFNAKTVFGGANSFDSAKMFIESANSDLTVNDYLHKLKNFSGAFGVYNATANNDFDFKAKLKIVKNGEIVIK